MMLGSLDPMRADPVGIDWVANTVKRRNVRLDRVYYDTDNLTAEERDWLIEVTTLEGAILVVFPRAWHRRIERFTEYEAFREGGDGRPSLEDFAVAGVGSSDLGAASLARALADHLDRPVGAVVAGYGMSDVVGEGLGGLVFFSPANKVRQAFASLETLSSVTATDPLTAPRQNLFGWPLWPGDTRTLIRLLAEPGRRVTTLIGHSKGALSIGAALNALDRERHPELQRRLDETRLITLGAVTTMPDGARDLHQVLGTADPLGWANSNLLATHIRVGGAGHSLSRHADHPLDLPAILASLP